MFLGHLIIAIRIWKRNGWVQQKVKQKAMSDFPWKICYCVNWFRWLPNTFCAPILWWLGCNYHVSNLRLCCRTNPIYLTLCAVNDVPDICLNTTQENLLEIIQQFMVCTVFNHDVLPSDKIMTANCKDGTTYDLVDSYHLLSVRLGIYTSMS